MYEKIQFEHGFMAALDQSGGSTPKALVAYGIDESEFAGDEQKMYDLVHEMRTRIITSPAFSGEKILGAILFEQTMDRDIEGRNTADYLWNIKRIVPFVKVDKGLADAENGVQMMKPMPELAGLLERAKGLGVFGTKMRSVIHEADRLGIASVVSQQFAVARQILDAGLMPIIEPEVNIQSATKAESEELLLAEILAQLETLGDEKVMLKLSLPTKPDFYRELTRHKNVLRVVALSGGYSQDEACELLAQNHGVVASFSRALSVDLTAQQSDEEFNQTLQTSVDKIYQASIS
jgi:fructose-bisphosphate aldolase class I